MKTALLGLCSLVASGAVLIAAGCYDASKPLPPHFPDYPAPAPFGTELDRTCAAACERLRALGCPEGSGSLGGEPCTVTCARASSLRPLPAACWAEAGTTADAKACGALRCIR